MKNAILNTFDFPIIDVAKTGEKLKMLLKEKNLTVKDVQIYMGFSTPQSIYCWMKGEYMPSIDNLYALSELLDVPIDNLISGNRRTKYRFTKESSNFS